MVIPRVQQRLPERVNAGLSAKIGIFVAKHKAATPRNGAENAQQWHLAVAFL
ncbi:hypothetical protein [Rheinheimera sp. MM224]|uniref:hypothetical protein n=1 Tax=Rheinheimera sp. MM224 TaxID=3019969 RepID=UPI0021F8B126|nr:hypothetical protein [Rheinheimera sp. MM224]